ncbi:MAG: GNAT family N-acetyltransferase [Fimbriimonadaceae bacterium]|nr:GNAT family N-acetyltransferase [Fimbriimonadaceae bacterium]
MATKIETGPMGVGEGADVARFVARTLPDEAISETRFARQVLLDPNFELEGARIARDDGRIVGLCLAMGRRTPLENAPDDSDRGYLTLLAVAPEYRRQGIARTLVQAAEAYHRDGGRRQVQVSPYAPGYFIPGPDEAVHAGAVALLESLGYGKVYRPLSMECPLWRLTVPDWVEQAERDLEARGVRIRNLDTGLILPTIEFSARVFAGDWVRYAREAAHAILAGDCPERLVVAVDESGPNPVVVGYSHHAAERFGPIGVDPQRRGEKIGQVLMYRTLRAQQRAGYRTAWFLWSDDRTAERIYNGAGFRESRRFVLMKKDL